MNRTSRSPSPIDERQKLESWQPKPLVPELDDKKDYSHILKPHIISSKANKYIIVDGVECLNLATHNYLGLAGDPRLEEASLAAARKYGVGSCGPRGFYGTMDIHLALEKEIADFLKVDEAILYSFGFSTIASAIPAYAKTNDIVYVDEYCNFAIQQGLAASRSEIIKFEHNNMADLERLIEISEKKQAKKYGNSNKVRSFIVVESIYSKTGDICPLKELVEVKKRHKIRLFIDESRSFGVLGTNGIGITQELGIDINDIDLIMVSLEHAICGFGGFCAGSSFVVDHQRLAGTGYCFSASLPPLQVASAMEAIKIIRREPELVLRAQEIFKFANECLEKLSVLENISDAMSPVKMIVLKLSLQRKSTNLEQYEQENHKLDSICKHILAQEKIAISVARYMVEEEMTTPVASIRLIMSGCLSKDDVRRICDVLEKCSLQIIERF